MLREGHCRLDGVSTSGGRSEWRAGMPVNWEDFGFAGRPGLDGGHWIWPAGVGASKEP